MLAPRDCLAKHRIYLASVHPDLLLRLCLIAAGDLYVHGRRDVGLHGATSFTINGRRPQPYYDPEVDLTRQRALLGPTSWVVPLTQPSRDRRAAVALSEDERWRR